MIDAVTLARDCIGTPFRLRGRQVGLGLDCFGMLLHVAQGIGALWEELDYSRFLRPAWVREQAARLMVPCDPAPGRVVLLYVRRPEFTQHFGIITETKPGTLGLLSRLVHCIEDRFVETGFGEPYLKAVCGIYDFRRLRCSTPSSPSSPATSSASR